MVQLSTDDVFDGLAQKPYTEFDNTNPKTVYGKSKCAGENYVKEFTHKHFIIRSNWVFGKGNNFVNRVLEAADQGRALAVAEDQYGSPTSAKDLARIILHLIRTMSTEPIMQPVRAFAIVMNLQKRFFALQAKRSS